MFVDVCHPIVQFADFIKFQSCANQAKCVEVSMTNSGERPSNSPGLEVPSIEKFSWESGFFH
eukprot:2203135-Ditylum_brightwellii.AAC.1